MLQLYKYKLWMDAEDITMKWNPVCGYPALPITPCSVMHGHRWRCPTFIANRVSLSCMLATDNLWPIDTSGRPGSINIPEHPRAVTNPWPLWSVLIYWEEKFVKVIAEIGFKRSDLHARWSWQPLFNAKIGTTGQIFLRTRMRADDFRQQDTDTICELFAN